ncbi:cyclic diguanylate phosphodiesterase [Klebsiella pneumoniae]|uniref:cyclic diguanylate phosphodiesterase n=1 Tax=Klebsiella pneumoniae TaxID=573 RepID=UPI0020CCCEDB|nr:cyclic diguanylate phosphodiesterase [Klebsiella pneumoniae]MCQ0522982.1 cyclic diguanylate phosphodiesterase [Klebsiella pneumoniae]
MQTAQKVITAYRHKRIIVCLLVALATLGATLAIRFISQRSVNEDYIRTAASQRVAALNDILRPLSAQRATLLPLVGKPCPDIHLTLRKMAASLQTIRSVALVTSGIVYCSSIFGPRQADLHRLQPALPAPRPLLLFSNDSSLLKGSPVLIQWYPAAESGLDGVMLVVNIELLGTLILNEKSALISDVSLQVGDQHMAEHLHFKGVQLAIDDFGTGNTSLSWLEKLRPDVLKIDRSFTSSVGIDSVNATVTDIIIALANRLHIVTVAEGVETLEQESYLRSHGVDVLQGFYYARPMPVEAFPAWLASREESEGESETTE